MVVQSDTGKVAQNTNISYTGSQCVNIIWKPQM